MGNLTLNEIIEAVNGSCIKKKSESFTGLSIDSRTIKEGELFFAIKGDRFDGHDYLDSALAKGGGAVVSKPIAKIPSKKAIIKVADTLKALQDLGRYRRIKSKVCVVGITGTNGKTTTKEMTASVLGKKFRVFKNTGNFNNHIGLPLCLAEIDGSYEVAVLEMGASKQGDIKELCEIALPDIGVLTNIGTAHLEGFGNMEALRATKLELSAFAKTLCVNVDDSFLIDGLSGYKGRLVGFGVSNEKYCDVFADDVSSDGGFVEFTLHISGESRRVGMAVSGLFNVYNALAASAVGHVIGLGMDEIKAGLEGFSGVTMRFSVQKKNGATLLLDLYNANPTSMEEALKELATTPAKRKIAVLGDMLELGSFAQEEHEKIAGMMNEMGVDIFIAVGVLMNSASRVFKGKCISAGDSVEARGILKTELKSGDAVLIKGSRGMRMEAAADAI